MRMAVVNAVDGVSGNTANGLVWAFQTKVGWEMQNYVMTKVSMLQTREHREVQWTWSRAGQGESGRLGDMFTVVMRGSCKSAGY